MSARDKKDSSFERIIADEYSQDTVIDLVDLEWQKFCGRLGTLREEFVRLTYDAPRPITPGAWFHDMIVDGRKRNVLIRDRRSSFGRPLFSVVINDLEVGLDTKDYLKVGEYIVDPDGNRLASRCTELSRGRDDTSWKTIPNETGQILFDRRVDNGCVSIGKYSPDPSFPKPKNRDMLSMLDLMMQQGIVAEDLVVNLQALGNSTYEPSARVLV